ncbi:MAG: SAM-dependent methyltransferase [Clostridia bacterium]|nr:SAM-dependent methyltransferase [Clostridia bacterium]
MEGALREFREREAEAFRVVLSLPEKGTDGPAKLTFEKKDGKGGAVWQSGMILNNKDLRETLADPAGRLGEKLPLYRQADLFFPGEQVTFRRSKKGKVTRTVNRGSTAAAKPKMDREKDYFIREGDPVPFLVDLGVFTKEYRVVRPMYDKFRQINRFLEILDDELRDFPKEEISILDFGCGKSYLTFLVYYYFTVLQGKKARVIGYDLKEDVVTRCGELAKKYGYDGMEFVVADVTRDVLTDRPIDLVISLHACDVATDYALAFAIRRRAPFIFSVPCCQKEINKAVKKGGGDLDLLLEHGLFKERLSALLTDAFRARILENRGYRVDVMEFVDLAHSPKNVMLRCRRTGRPSAGLDDLLKLEARYGFRQTLLHVLEDENG